MKILTVLLFALHTAVAQPEAARDLSNQALDAYDHRDYVNAERLGREAVRKWESLGDAYHPHLGITRMNLAQAFAIQGNRTEALDQLQQSIALLREAFGDRNIHTLTAMNLLGGLYLGLGDTENAERVLNETLPIAREIDPNGIQTARALAGLSSVRLREQHLAEAQSLADESLRLAIRVSGEDSMDAALAYGAAAEVHRTAGRDDRALPLYHRARAIYERLLGPQDTRVAAVLAQEALILIHDKKFALADQELRRSIDILDRSCPACSVERWNAESALGLLRTRQGKYEEADRLFTHILSLQESTNPQPFADVAATRNALSFVRAKEHR